MLTKSILAASAIALAAGLGSASAGERFATLDGVPASLLQPSELDAVRGQVIILKINILCGTVTCPLIFLEMPDASYGDIFGNATGQQGLDGADEQGIFPPSSLPDNPVDTFNI